MRERAKKEKCTEVVGEFEKCCKDSGFSMVWKCQKQNVAMKDCLTEWYRNEQFVQECTDIYLKERSEYRRTGLTQKERQSMKN